MGINAVIQKAEEVANILRDNGHDELAMLVEKHAGAIHARPDSELKVLIGLCSARGLNDTSISTIPYTEWYGHVNKLEQKARRALKQLTNEDE